MCRLVVCVLNDNPPLSTPDNAILIATPFSKLLHGIMQDRRSGYFAGKWVRRSQRLDERRLKPFQSMQSSLQAIKDANYTASFGPGCLPIVSFRRES
jgi:hypothetical protein